MVMVTPVLGTPTSGVLTNCTGYTNLQLPAKNSAISSSSGAFAGGAGTGPTQVTNLSVTLTTTGRPVWVGLIDDASGIASGVYPDNAGSGSVYFFTGGTCIAIMAVATAGTPVVYIPVASFSTIDSPVAGTYTYTVQYVNITANLNIRQAKLFAYEL